MGSILDEKMTQQDTSLDFAQSLKREEDTKHWGILNFGVNDSDVPDINAIVRLALTVNSIILSSFSRNAVKIRLKVSTNIQANYNEGLAHFISTGVMVNNESASFLKRDVRIHSNPTEGLYNKCNGCRSNALFVNKRNISHIHLSQIVYNDYRMLRELGAFSGCWADAYQKFSNFITDNTHLKQEHGLLYAKTTSSFSEQMSRLATDIDVKNEAVRLLNKEGQVNTSIAKIMVADVGFYTEYTRWLYYGKSPNVQVDNNDCDDYQGNNTLNFECLWSHGNGLLNFGVLCQWQNDTLIYDGVIFVHNDISLLNLDTGEDIKMFSGDIGIDDNSYMWAFNANVAFDTVLEKGTLVELNINSHQWKLIINNIVPSEEFNNRVVKISGRSQSLVLGSPFVDYRGHKYTEPFYSAQIAQAEIDRIGGFEIDWRLVDTLGWQVPANTYNYTHYTPINALVDIAESGGGFINSHTTEKKLIVKSRFPTPSWEWDELTPDIEIVPSLIWSAQASKTEQRSYNGVWVGGEKNGVLANITRLGTDGATLANQVIHPLITDQSVAIHRGKGELSKAGITYHNSIVTPLHSDIGLLTPSDYVTLLGKVGIVRSVKIGFSVDGRGVVDVKNSLMVDTVSRVIEESNPSTIT